MLDETKTLIKSVEEVSSMETMPLEQKLVLEERVIALLSHLVASYPAADQTKIDGLTHEEAQRFRQDVIDGVKEVNPAFIPALVMRHVIYLNRTFLTRPIDEVPEWKAYTDRHSTFILGERPTD